MNGYESAEAIRKLPNTATIPIIALTAGTVVGEKEKCIESGMNDYIPKPIDKELLEKVIRDLMKLN
jgi:CheY-like chemotaxis protein